MAAKDVYMDFQYSKNVTKKFDENRGFFLTRLRCTDFLPYMTKFDTFDQGKPFFGGK